MPDPHIALRDAAASYGDRLVFEDLTLEIPAGQVTALCGPNGCGKSTALKAMRRLLPLRHGAALLADRPVSERSAKTLAREIAMLGQTPEAPDDLTVRDLAGLGRYAHANRFSGPGPADRAAVDAALSAVDLSDLADRPIAALSGGQLQRAWLAMTVAQAAPAILLDEPTNHLDIAHALETLDLVRRLAHELGRTVVVVLHDLNLAARFADRLVLFKDGGVAGQGPVQDVFRPELISQVFDIDCEVITTRAGPLLVPFRQKAAGDGEGYCFAA
ncbi:ABC transporter ATP-binding protein [Limimaricola sp.]|uniref:ABC transporter ATP-binding protein n=1 Tax=Limimaricola sp. TaxID=2211665 RepID=UPI004059A700